MIIIRLPVRIDIPRCFKPGRITRHANLIRVLVNPNIIKPQIRRHILADTLILRRKVICHTQIHDHAHRFERDHALTDVSIGPDGAPVEGPSFVGADEPGDVSCGTGGIFEGEDLVFCAVVPAAVEICEARHGLLVDAATVGVNLGDAGIVNGRVV